eukprot:2662295-Rhodomonas_salina.1
MKQAVTKVITCGKTGARPSNLVRINILPRLRLQKAPSSRVLFPPASNRREIREEESGSGLEFEARVIERSLPPNSTPDLCPSTLSVDRQTEGLGGKLSQDLLFMTVQELSSPWLLGCQPQTCSVLHCCPAFRGWKIISCFLFAVDPKTSCVRRNARRSICDTELRDVSNNKQPESCRPNASSFQSL